MQKTVSSEEEIAAVAQSLPRNDRRQTKEDRGQRTEDGSMDNEQ